MTGPERWVFPGGVTYEVWPEQNTACTKFPDGSHLLAQPQEGRSYIEQARALGYVGDDREAVWTMCREHDLLHHVLASLEGGTSETLRAMAVGGQAYARWRQEEERVLGLQRYINQMRAEGEVA